MSLVEKQHSGPTLPRGAACFRCKRNKKKCDAARPACAECSNAGQASECQYKNPERIKQPSPKPPSFAVQRWQLAKLTGSDSIGAEILAMDLCVEWWKLDEIPSPIRDYLMIVFLNHTPQVYFDELAPSVISRMSRFAPSHPDHPHRSLVNAMCLMASHFLSSSSHPAHIDRRMKWDPDAIEKTFLQGARKYMLAQPSKTENFFNFLLTMELLTLYYFWCGKIDEGHDEGLSAIRMATACNLHKISSPEVSDYPASILPPPTTSAEVRDRANAFWHAFKMDRARRIISSLDLLLTDDMITTVFPVKLEEGVPNSPPLDDRPRTVSSLLDVGTQDASNDTLNVMGVKVVAFIAIIDAVLLKVAAQGASRPGEMPPDIYDEFYTTEVAFTDYGNSIPSDPPPVSPSANLTAFDSIVATLAKLRSTCQAGIIRLHTPFLRNDPGSRTKSLIAAIEIVRIARDLGKTNEIYWQLPIHFTWKAACTVLQFELGRLLTRGRIGRQEEWKLSDIRSDMEFLATMTRRFVRVYRFQHAVLSFIEELLARDAQALEKLAVISPCTR